MDVPVLGERVEDDPLLRSGVDQPFLDFICDFNAFITFRRLYLTVTARLLSAAFPD